MTRRIVAVIVAAVVLTACTPAEVTAVFANAGVELNTDQASAVADWTNRDCLPAYTSPRDAECAIRDSWLAFDVPATLHDWAELAWCESNHNPTADNPHSSAAGLFQHLARYFPARAAAAGFPDADIHNPRANAYAAAWLAATSGLSHWTQCL